MWASVSSGRRLHGPTAQLDQCKPPNKQDRIVAFHLSPLPSHSLLHSILSNHRQFLTGRTPTRHNRSLASRLRGGRRARRQCRWSAGRRRAPASLGVMLRGVANASRWCGMPSRVVPSLSCSARRPHGPATSIGRDARTSGSLSSVAAWPRGCGGTRLCVRSTPLAVVPLRLLLWIFLFWTYASVAMVLVIFGSYFSPFLRWLRGVDGGLGC